MVLNKQAVTVAYHVEALMHEDTGKAGGVDAYVTKAHLMDRVGDSTETVFLWLAQ